MQNTLQKIATAIVLFAATALSANAQHQPIQSDHASRHAARSKEVIMGDAQPMQPGQDAFGTIQEIVKILEADPKTDWSKVNIAALRDHLIDMNEVTLKARSEQYSLRDGIELTVTGDGRTLEAIKRMIPAQSTQITKLGIWTAKTEDIANGIKLTVTSADQNQVIKLTALGLLGLMVQSSHHQQHHLMLARGEPLH